MTSLDARALAKSRPRWAGVGGIAMRALATAAIPGFGSAAGIAKPIKHRRVELTQTDLDHITAKCHVPMGFQTLRGNSAGLSPSAWPQGAVPSKTQDTQLTCGFNSLRDSGVSSFSFIGNAASPNESK